MANPVGHPIVYPDELLFEILRRYGEGENLLKILDEEGMPKWSVIFDRCIADDAPNKDLTAAYERAQQGWASHSIALCQRIADEQQEGEEVTVSDGPKGVTTTVKKVDLLGHRTLRVKTKQWMAERVLAKYAPKQTLQNPDGTAVNFQPVVNIVPYDPKAKTGG